jgi:uncharacterized protein
MLYLFRQRESAKLLFSRQGAKTPSLKKFNKKHLGDMVSCRLSLVFLFAFYLAGSAWSLEIPLPSDNYVNDYASLLSPEAKERLEQHLRKLGAETTTQIVVATFPSLEDQSLEDFTNRMYEAWKIGQKGKDNGVLLAVFVQERKVRIEVGYGLEGALPDALSGQIIRNEFVPHFRAGNAEKGIESTVIAIEKAVRGEYKAPEQKPQEFPTLLAILFLIFFIYMMYQMGKRRSGYTIGPYNRRRRGYDGGIYPGGWTGGFGGGDFGGGGGGGGFGGFSGGGGLSGGGGASGSW